MLRSNAFPTTALTSITTRSEVLSHDREFSVGNPANLNSTLSMTEPLFWDSRPVGNELDSYSAGTHSSSPSVFELTPSQFFGSDTFVDPLMSTADTQLLIVDPNVENWESLIEGLTANVPSDQIRLVLLDANRAGLEQITETIKEFDELGVVHLISHGQAGELKLGNGQLGGELSPKEIRQISSWRNHLSANADILIYGCDLASNAAGRDLVSSMARLSGADIAASNDLTGSRLLSGDWDLEFTTGKIEHLGSVEKLAQAQWHGVLETVNIDNAWLTAHGAGPYYLDQSNTTYVLQTDVTTPGTAFAIIGRNVDFDLNGHTVTYNESNPISIANHSFETGTGATANQWSFANSGTGHRYQGEYLENEVYDGDHSLRFGVTNGDQYVSSTTTVNLEANTTYSLSSMMYFDVPGSVAGNNPGVDIYVRLESTTTSKEFEAVWDNSNWRGIQLTEKTFTTGGSSESFKIIAGVRHHTALADRYGIIDDIKIQKFRNYGVTVSAHGWASAYYPSLNQYGWGHNATISNGTIVQGRDQATSSHGVFIHSTPNATIDNLDVTISGADSSGVYARDNSTGMTIKNSDFTSNVQTITTRDHFDSAVLFGVGGDIFGNTIHNGVHAGIYVNQGGAKVHDNTIRLKAKYTNAFAIVGGQEIYNNLIDNGAGEYNSRGIGTGGGSSANPKKIYNNTIRVQGFVNNQEYFGAPLGGAYGIQVEGGAQIEIYGNDVTANATDTEAYAFRMNESTESTYVHVHDNVFRGMRIGSQFDAASVRMTNVPHETVFFENNVLESNDQWLGQSSGVDRIVFQGDTLKAVGDTTGFKALESYNWQGNNTTAVLDLEFIDTEFANSASRDLFVDSPFHGAVSGADNRSSFNQRFNTTFRIISENGTSLANANVKVFDKNNQQVFNGTSDAGGIVTALLREFRTQGSNKDSYGPFTVRATSGATVRELEFDADKKQTIDVRIDGNDPEFSFSYDGPVLTVVATSADNHFQWDASTPFELTIDGQQFDILPGTTHVDLFGRQGNDRVTAVGTADEDTLIGGPSGSRFETQAMEISFYQTEIHEIDGAGGEDETFLTDSDGNDVVELSDNFASVVADNWRLEASNFPTQSVRAVNGGSDSIEVSTVLNSSVLNGRDKWMSLRSGATYKSIFGFDSVEINAFGTENSLYYEDSSGDDVFDLTTAAVTYSNSSIEVTANGFDTQVVTAVLGGNDSVEFGNTEFSDKVVFRPDALALTGGNHYWRAAGFDSIKATGSVSQNDEVFTQDSDSDDSFEATPTTATLSNEDFTLELNGFSRTRTDFRNGGFDDVAMIGSDGEDIVVGSPDQLRLRGDGYDHFVKQFDEAFVDGGLSIDAAYLVDTSGDDSLVLREVGFHFTSPNATIVGTGFETKSVSATQGGNDEVILYDTGHNDTIVSNSEFTVVRNSFNIYNRTAGFDTVELRQAKIGDDDHLTLYGSTGPDQYSFIGRSATVSDGTSGRSFNGVDRVVAYWDSASDIINNNDPDFTLTLIDQAECSDDNC